ncbi:Chemotaxis protein CheW [bacterium HR37]|jgi:purine-binding chemotaxis protein CheW|nr:Chemotaxis protein CheW [bacterium HR37]
MRLNSDVLQLVTFRLGEEEYAIDILKVQEIIRMVEVTPIPNAPYVVEGVINLRGRVIPVVNLRKKFGVQGDCSTAQSKIIVVDIGIICGLIVDTVSEVLRLPLDSVEPPPSFANNAGSRAIKGIGKLDDRLLILLEVSRLFENSELNTMGQITGEGEV